MDEDPLDELNRRQWHSLHDMPTPLYSFAAVAWDENRAIITGGENVDGDPVNSVFAYDKRNGEIQELPPMTVERSRHAAVIVGNRLFAMAGEGALYMEPHGTIEVLNLNDIQQGWQLLPLRMETPRSSCAAVNVNGKIYIIGGCSFPHNYFSSVKILDTTVEPSQAALIQGPNMTQSRSNHTAALVGNSILVAGGWIHEDYRYQFAPSMEMLCLTEAAPQWQVLRGNMPIPRVDATAVTVGDCMLLIGGRTEEWRELNSTHVWNHTTQSWSQLPATLNTACRLTTAVTLGDDVVVLGGIDSGSELLASVGRFFISRQDVFHQRLQELGIPELLAQDDVPALFWARFVSETDNRRWLSCLYHLVREKHVDILSRA